MGLRLPPYLCACCANIFNMVIGKSYLLAPAITHGSRSFKWEELLCWRQRLCLELWCFYNNKVDWKRLFRWICMFYRWFLRHEWGFVFAASRQCSNFINKGNAPVVSCTWAEKLQTFLLHFCVPAVGQSEERWRCCQTVDNVFNRIAATIPIVGEWVSGRKS